MLTESHDEIYFDDEARTRAYHAVSALQKRLPDEALHQLAEEVIRRLADRFAPAEQDAAVLPDEEIDALADAVIAGDPDAGLSFVLDRQRQGVGRDAIYLGYLAGAARRLGERWENDTLPFTTVTVGAARLYIIMRALRPTFMAAGQQETGLALFASTPGEDHTLGVTMAADMFRERGWQIDLKTGCEHDELVEIAAEGRYPIVGLSASSGRMILPLTRLIASLRVTSPGSSIFVSGELTTIEPDLAKIVDADSIVSDAPSALAEMQRVSDLISGKSSGSRPVARSG